MKDGLGRITSQSFKSSLCLQWNTVKNSCATSTSLSRLRPALTIGKIRARRVVVKMGAVDYFCAHTCSMCPIIFVCPREGSPHYHSVMQIRQWRLMGAGRFHSFDQLLHVNMFFISFKNWHMGEICAVSASHFLLSVLEWIVTHFLWSVLEWTVTNTHLNKRSMDFGGLLDNSSRYGKW